MPTNKRKTRQSKQKVVSRASARYLREINAVRVSREDILQFVRETSAMPKEDRDFEGFAIAAIRLHPGNPDLAGALMFRMQALARLIGSPAVRGWTYPEAPDGATWASEPVFAAAAVEPLVEDNGKLTFEPQSFGRRVLELAELDEES